MSWWVHKYGQAISKTKTTLFKTRFTEKFNVSFPIVCAPMTLGVAGRTFYMPPQPPSLTPLLLYLYPIHSSSWRALGFDLAAAVAAKGCLGFLGCGDVGKPQLEREHYWGLLPVGQLATKFHHAEKVAGISNAGNLGIGKPQQKYPPLLPTHN
jgi:hypothetical protein